MTKKDQKNTENVPESTQDNEKIVTVGILSQYMFDFKTDFKAELMVDIKMEINPLKREIEAVREEVDIVKSNIVTIKADILATKSDILVIKSDIDNIKSSIEDIKSMLRQIMRYIEANEEDKVITNKRLDRLESKLLLA